jgi:NAD-dependent oxidoreductase involved in siderophore biosynthesis
MLACRALVSLKDVREVLIVKKPRQGDASARLLQIAEWLTQRGIKVVVERPVHATEAPQVQRRAGYRG